MKRNVTVLLACYILRPGPLETIVISRSVNLTNSICLQNNIFLIPHAQQIVGRIHSTFCLQEIRSQQLQTVQSYYLQSKQSITRVQLI